jgi:hypothetical protein
VHVGRTANNLGEYWFDSCENCDMQDTCTFFCLTWTLGSMEWEILIDPLVDRYMFEGSLIQEDVRQVSDLFSRW